MTKKRLFTATVLAIHVILTSAKAQNSIFEHETPITWLGLDFTAAVFIGDADKFRSDSIVYDFMYDLNTLMIEEPDKYNIAEVFEKAHVENAIDITRDRNDNIKASALRSASKGNFPALTPQIIEAIVSRYDFSGYNGIGLMFNIESFSKVSEKGTLWVTFIDMTTKEVLLTKKLMGQPGGFGLRNYWGGCIYGILKQIRRHEYLTWKNRYYRH